MGGTVWTGVTVTSQAQLREAVGFDPTSCCLISPRMASSGCSVTNSLGGSGVHSPGTGTGQPCTRSTWRSRVTFRGGTRTVVAPARCIWAGLPRRSSPPRPRPLAGRCRSAGSVNPIWAYAHVPNGYAGDATEAVIDQIERFAPGARDQIVGTYARTAVQMAAYNPNYVGGDISAGANTASQIAFRPRIARNPYSLGVPGVYLCSSTAPPGGGVHGMCGFNAAGAALNRI